MKTIEIPDETWERMQGVAARAKMTPIDHLSAVYRQLADEALLDDQKRKPGGGFLDPRLSGGPGARD